MDLFYFVPGYTEAIYQTVRQPAFVMMLAFIVTFIIARGYTRLARVYGWGGVSVGDVHTHHLVFGLIMAFTAGAAIIGFTPNDTSGWFLLLSALFGVGVALVLDEFALVFHLQDVYWEREGRKSIDAIVLALIFGGFFLLRLTPLGTETDETGWLLVAVVLSNLAIVVLAALKGKIYMALFGLFIPFLALIAAIRVAEPGSVWTRKFYTNKPKKRQKALCRYEHYEQVWRVRKERAWDIIGGKPWRPDR